MNRHDRRIQQAKTRKTLREIQRSGYSPVKDPEFIKGIAMTVRAVEFTGLSKVGGYCLLRSLVAMQALQNCNVNSSLHVGGMLYRVAPDPTRDVVAFCGGGNAGVGPIYHSWLEVDGHILDFSVGDWRGIDWATPVNAAEIEGLLGHRVAQAELELGPIQWALTPPDYWCRPREELTGPWRPTGAPKLGVAWYGPYNDDPMVASKNIRDIAEDIGLQVAEAVENVVAQAAVRQGIARPRKELRPVRIESHHREQSRYRALRHDEDLDADDLQARRLQSR